MSYSCRPTAQQCGIRAPSATCTTAQRKDRGLREDALPETAGAGHLLLAPFCSSNTRGLQSPPETQRFEGENQIVLISACPALTCWGMTLEAVLTLWWIQTCSLPPQRPHPVIHSRRMTVKTPLPPWWERPVLQTPPPLSIIQSGVKQEWNPVHSFLHLFYNTWWPPNGLPFCSLSHRQFKNKTKKHLAFPLWCRG